MILRALLLILLLVWSSPLNASTASRQQRAFEFPADVLSFANELRWEYDPGADHGRITTHSRVPPPSYTLHCFVLARTAKQFFDHAQFDPNEPKATHACYRYLIRRVLASGRNELAADSERLTIPGYRNLQEFSRDHEALLKSEIGGAWQSFLQRGNWRMIFPFTGKHQQRTAQQLVYRLEKGRPSLVHLICFPSLTLNHFILIFDCQRTNEGLDLTAYDPNEPERVRILRYQTRQQRFELGRTSYFVGGRVKVYEVYRGLFY